MFDGVWSPNISRLDRPLGYNWFGRRICSNIFEVSFKTAAHKSSRFEFSGAYRATRNNILKRVSVDENGPNYAKRSAFSFYSARLMIDF